MHAVAGPRVLIQQDVSFYAEVDKYRMYRHSNASRVLAVRRPAKGVALVAPRGGTSRDFKRGVQSAKERLSSTLAHLWLVSRYETAGGDHIAVSASDVPHLIIFEEGDEHDASN